MKIGLLSDTHSCYDTKFETHFADCDEIWHAGDIGDVSVANKLEQFKPFRAVYGNIDSPELRRKYPEVLSFTIEGLKVFMIHIGGYPGRYKTKVKQLLDEEKPDLYICGHSHILKIMPDKQRDLLHINPGACGYHGFHQVRTLVKFSIDNGIIHELQVIEIGSRGDIL